MRELSATGFMSNRGRQVTFDTWPHEQHNCRGLNYAGHEFPIIHLYNCSLCRLSAHFLYEIWVSIGEWEQNGLKHVYWIMTQLQIMVTGHMEQVGPVFYDLLVPNVTRFWIEQWTNKCILMNWNWLKFNCCTLTGVGNDPREDRYFSIPKQVSIILQTTNLNTYLARLNSYPKN
jgi:hypothetical protein